MRRILVAFTVFLCSVGMVSHAAEQQSSACIVCHRVLGGSYGLAVTKWRISAHWKAKITCTDCHGGNANVEVGNVNALTSKRYAEVRALAMSKDHGFIARPAGKTMFLLCSTCHKPTVDRYARSIMGQAYLDGKGGPSCTTCHDAHKGRIPDRTAVCERCHDNTIGFSQIDPMNVKQSTVNRLSRIRVAFAMKKVAGEPLPAPLMPTRDLGSFEIGLTAFGAVLMLFLVGFIIYLTLERRG